MKRTIEINDTLQERTDQAIEDLKEMIDSCLPVYTHEIDSIWFMNKYELIESFENSGFDGYAYQHDGMTAIYLYIEDRCVRWWNNNHIAIQLTVNKLKTVNRKSVSKIEALHLTNGVLKCHK